ncbi:MAG: aminopeptidase P family protein [Clostridium sp.]|jgi:Xaa-Pro aminopeptidase|nr:aminopeptidase P family protein [Clostridium sp.]
MDTMMLIRKQRMERGFQAMREQNVDLWIAAGRDLMHKGEPMLNYLLTFEMGGPVAIILTRDGTSYAINSPMETEELESMGLFSKVIANVDGYAGIRDFVAEKVRELQPQTIALNYSEKDITSDGLSFTLYRILTEAFQQGGFDGTVCSSQNLMKYLRANRSKEEVELIRAAVQESMKIYQEARPQMHLGMNGMDIQRLFQSIADRKGYGYSWPKYGNPFNSIGPRSSYLCKRPADDVYIQPGDVVNVDFGIIVNGASSDNQRTFYALRAGETQPPEEVVRAFNTIGEVNCALAEHMKAGVKSGDILKYANEIFVKNGYPERNGGFGHEIGYYAHDGVISPGTSRCEPDIDATFLEGMTFTLEPAILTSFGRVCREEVVVVGKEKGEILSTLQDEIWLIEK